MKKTLLIALGLVVSFCSKPVQKTMTVSGEIDGLRKGTLFLQKIIDTTLTSVDSITISGGNQFQLADNIENPEFYILSLAINDSLDEKILFFGEKGNIKINTRLRTFGSSAEITGSTNHTLWEEYQSIMRKFNNQNLQNYQKVLDESKELSAEERDAALEASNNNMLKRKYLYAINFAMNNADKDVAAYIGRFEINDAVPQFLDSLYNKLSPEVKEGKYGKLFEEQLNARAE